MTVCGQGGLRRKQSPTSFNECGLKSALRWLLILSTGALLVAAYFVGVARGLNSYIGLYDGGPFLLAVCATATKWQTGIGDYVCLRDILDIMQPTHGVMYDLGLRLDGSSWDFLFNTNVLDRQLHALFAQPSWVVPKTTSGPPYHGIQGIGWGMDEGYYNYVSLAFLLFGPSVEALYKTYWLLLGCSAAAYVVANRHSLPFLTLLVPQRSFNTWSFRRRYWVSRPKSVPSQIPEAHVFSLACAWFRCCIF